MFILFIHRHKWLMFFCFDGKFTLMIYTIHGSYGVMYANDMMRPLKWCFFFTTSWKSPFEISSRLGDANLDEPGIGMVEHFTAENLPGSRYLLPYF